MSSRRVALILIERRAAINSRRQSIFPLTVFKDALVVVGIGRHVKFAPQDIVDVRALHLVPDGIVAETGSEAVLT